MAAPADKFLLRSKVRMAVAALAPADRERWSAAACELIRQQAIWRDARGILLFSPLPSELNVRALLEEAWARNRVAALPRFDGARQCYSACRVGSAAELASGQFGILEPASNCPVLPLNQLDLALVPGVAFDLTGRRLGRGKGFYDRLLAEVPGHKCGVAFEVQIVAQLPEEPHDVRVDSILTPSRWHLCRRAV